MIIDTKDHWNNVYETKSSHEVSWTQKIPKISLELIYSIGNNKNLKIIDVGGGNSKLIDFLIEKGYKNLTVLDISSVAIEKAKQRLGQKANSVHWINTDIIDFKPKQNYDIWHDRACFHFLTENKQKNSYKKLVDEFVDKQLIIGTFSKTGPQKCSGLNISQYSNEELSSFFNTKFELTENLKENHKTPFKTIQNFTFCSFKKKEIIPQK